MIVKDKNTKKGRKYYIKIFIIDLVAALRTINLL